MVTNMKKLIGNAIVGQSGGPTSAINASLAGVIRGFIPEHKNGTVEKLYGMRNGIEGFLAGDIVDLTDFFSNEKKIDLLTQTPASALGSCRTKLPKVEENNEIYEKLLALFMKHNIRYFFYIGGNDSMDTVAKLTEYMDSCEYEMRVIGIPKTIDNDLVETDHTPGFGSAAKFVATTMQEILWDCSVYTKKAVTIVEIMGRDAGWLTASSALGRIVSGVAPDFVYLPERNFNMDNFLQDIRSALEVHPNVVVAVSEGIRYADGRYVGEDTQSGATDVFGHKYLAGSGKTLELIIKEKIGCKVRSIELSLPQRCAAHIASLTDITESSLIGEEAVKTACLGVSGVMMNFVRKSTNPYATEISYTDVALVANKKKDVPSEFINSEGNNVTDECLEYLLPLIAGEVNKEYKDGLPVHIII